MENKGIYIHLGVFGKYTEQLFKGHMDRMDKKLDILKQRIAGYKQMNHQLADLLYDLTQRGINIDEIAIIPDYNITRPYLFINHIEDKEKMDKALKELKDDYSYDDWKWKVSSLRIYYSNQ